MLEMGILVAIGLIAMFSKLGWRKRMWCLSNPVALDVTVFTLLAFLHWGTFSGMMVAAIGSLFCSLCISLGRKIFGFAENGVYQPGWLDISSSL